VILAGSRIIVGEAEAIALRESLMEGVPLEAAGVWFSHNSGYDMSQLLPRFSLRELQELQGRLVAANASPVGFVGLLLKKYGENAEITREDFFTHGLRAATGYSLTIAGTVAQVADQIEEMFEATGSRGGFMISVSQGSPRAIMLNIIDYLVPELQRRGRYRSAYTGRTLRENLAT